MQPLLVRRHCRQFRELKNDELKKLIQFMDLEYIGKYGKNKLSDFIYTQMSHYINKHQLDYTMVRLIYIDISSYITKHKLTIYYPICHNLYHHFRKVSVNHYANINHDTRCHYKYDKVWKYLNNNIITNQILIDMLTRFKRVVDYLELRETYIQLHYLLMPDLIHYTILKLIKLY